MARKASADNNMAVTHPELAAEFHPTKNGDLIPEELIAGTGKKLWWRCNTDPTHEWIATGDYRTGGHGCPMCKSMRVTNPELAAEFHPTKNGDLTPYEVVAGTGKKLWWRCSTNPTHEWVATGDKRKGGQGCPYCSGHRVSASNNMAVTNPELAAEFHPTKNGDLTPYGVMAGTNKKLWWQCRVDPLHEWEATGNTRTGKESGCPYCSGQRVSASNNMAVTNPELAAEFHPTKNGDLTPYGVMAGTNKKLWWQCRVDPLHEWEAAGNTRNRGSGCPMCARQRVSASNSMAVTNPELAAEFHPTKNGDLTPLGILVGTSAKLWWQCNADSSHEWEATGNDRKTGQGCPYCSGRRVSASNNMAVTSPALAAEFHPTRNGILTPYDVLAGTNKKLWWQCSTDSTHEWEETANNRRSGRGCPYCSGRRVSASNNMAVTAPALAAEFHPTRNGILTPYDVVAGTNKKLWWQCSTDLSHEWEAAGNTRKQGSGCPICNAGWTVESVRLFVKGLLDSRLYVSLDAAEMWLLFQQNGLLSDNQTKRTEFVKALGTGRLDEGDLEAFAGGRESPIDALISGAVDATSLLEFGSVDDLDLVAEEVDLLDGVVADGLDSVDGRLPALSVSDALDALESSVWASADLEAVEFLEASAVRKMWREAYDPDQLAAALEQSAVPREQEASERPRRRFYDELSAALSFELPQGYDFRIEGELVEPVLMQRHVATLVRDRGRVGNWSGTGAGKTLSAVLASRVVDAAVTVVCCPNATVSGWKDTIQNAFPSARVITKTLSPVWPAGDGPRYLVVNYEAFQQPNSEPDVKALCESAPIDMVVVDEIHYAKQRTDQASLRRRLVEGLIAAATKAKHARHGTDLRVLGMSATPVINNLREGISMIELVTGIAHDDLSDRTNIPNAMRVYQRLTTLGTRWMPPYPSYGEHNPRINITDRLDDVLAVTAGGMASSMLALEQLLLEEKLGTIVEYIHPAGGTVIYTEFVNGMVDPLVQRLREAGHTVGVYTGLDKSGLEPFLNREVDVLVGSSTIGTGVDGLQHVASRLIVASAPWTAAGYEQLIGRLVRTGQREQVDVVFPLTYIETAEGQWSYDESSRLNRIRYKKTVADAAVDGVVPEGALRSPADAYKDAVAWLERLAAGDYTEPIQRHIITVPLSADRVEVERRAGTYGDFARMNGHWNQTASAKTHARLVGEPGEWENYHTLYQQARATWTWVPYVELAKDIGRGSKNLVVADFGCGEDLLGQQLRKTGFTVHSFDHISITESVTALDISEGVPLDGAEIDIAVFSLSLMGHNNGDYLREAARVLAYDGRIHIVEAASRLDKIDDIEDRLQRLGFKLTDISRIGVPEFVHIGATRTAEEPDPATNLI